MSHLRFLSLLVLIFHLSLGVAHAQGADPPRTGPPEGASSRAFHQRLEKLAREFHSLMEQARSSRAEIGSVQREAARSRDVLRGLEGELRRLDRSAAVPLRDKLLRLRTLLDDVERALDQRSVSSEGARAPGEGATAVPFVRRPFTKAAPANDACAQAIDVTLGETVVGDLSGATHDGEASCGSSFFAPDVWFRYVPAETGYVSADLFGSDYDTVLSVHFDCPGTRSGELVCNDDTVGLESAVGFYAYAYSGEPYWIRVSGFNGATGSYTLHLGTGGTLEGTVTSAADGTPLEAGQVKARNPDDYYYYTRTATTGAAGEYTLSALSPQAYRIWTEGFAGFTEELHQEIPCPEGTCDITSGDPVTVASDGTVTVDFALDAGGAVSGTVTETAAGAVEGVRVALYTAAGQLLEEVTTDSAGFYQIGGLPSGNYFAVAKDSDFVDELYDDMACLGGGYYYYYCDVTTGTPIVVTAPQTTPGIDFVLDRLGAISGAVTEAVSGDPLPDVYVEIWKADGSHVKATTTDAGGLYSVGGLSPGDYVAVAESYLYVDEIYDDVPCPGGYYSGCTAADGTPIAVAVNVTTSGIDFALDLLGTLSGTVTDAVAGTPIANVQVTISHAGGYYFPSAYTDASGAYLFTGLEPDTYYLTAFHADYVDELYDGLPCGNSCDPFSGTGVAVGANSDVTGIDFALEPGGVITGTVSDAGGAPVNTFVDVYDATGQFVASDYTDASGLYSVGGLGTGTYFARTESPYYYYYDFIDELWDDLLCHPGCDVTSGTPIAVTAGSPTSGVDFVLDRVGAISGTVTDATTGDPVRIAVYVYDADGLYVTSAYSDSYTGQYTVSGLAPGTYFLLTNSYSGYLDEIYDDVPCGGSCDPTAGTPVSVALSATTEGINFALDRGGAIDVTVMDAATGAPLDLWVELYDAAGGYVTDSYTYSGGPASFTNLSPGTYYVLTDRYSGYLAEVYDGVFCLDTCDPTKGTPIQAPPNTTVEILMALLPADAQGITGYVKSEAGTRLEGAAVELWDESGNFVTSTTTLATGEYFLSGIAAGTYFVSTSNGLGLTDEVWQGAPCLGGPCDPTTGAPVTVEESGPSALTAGIDFTLAGELIFLDGFESGDVSTWSGSSGIN